MYLFLALGVFFLLGTIMMLEEKIWGAVLFYLGLSGLFFFFYFRKKRKWKKKDVECPRQSNTIGFQTCSKCGHIITGMECVYCRPSVTPAISRQQSADNSGSVFDNTRQQAKANDREYGYRLTENSTEYLFENRVSYEKASKIVSIFSKTWSDVAAKEFIVIDLETTGLEKRWDRIIEISAIRYRNGIEQDKFYTLVRPDCEIPIASIRIHGITDKMVRKAPGIDHVIPSLIDYLGDALLVGHNANFDIGFIEVWARRCGYNPSWSYVDTISVAKKVLPGLPNYKQQTILDYIGYSQETYHRAEADCYGCAEIMLLGLNSVTGSFDL